MLQLNWEVIAESRIVRWKTDRRGFKECVSRKSDGERENKHVEGSLWSIKSELSVFLPISPVWRTLDMSVPVSSAQSLLLLLSITSNWQVITIVLNAIIVQYEVMMWILLVISKADAHI